MPTDLGRRWAPDYTGYPPHMSPEDEQIWRELRGQLTAGATALYFDVGLGAGRDAGTEQDPNLRRMWLRLNQKRADVIVERPDSWTIIELRANALSNVVGRLLMYDQLWKEEPPDARPLKLLLATDTEDADLARLAHAQGIEYITTAPPRQAQG